MWWVGDQEGGESEGVAEGRVRPSRRGLDQERPQEDLLAHLLRASTALSTPPANASCQLHELSGKVGHPRNTKHETIALVPPLFLFFFFITLKPRVE